MGGTIARCMHKYTHEQTIVWIDSCMNRHFVWTSLYVSMIPKTGQFSKTGVQNKHPITILSSFEDREK